MKRILLVILIAGILEIIFLLLIEWIRWKWRNRKTKIERLKDKLRKLDDKKEKIQKQISKEYKKSWERFYHDSVYYYL